MTVAQFQRFIDHAYWGLDQLLDALEAGTAEEFASTPLTGLRSPREILVHMLGFERFWGSPLHGTDSVEKLDLESIDSVAALREQWDPVREAWLSFMAGLSDAWLDEKVTIETPQRGKFEPELRRVLSQFVQHQGQHRSEVAALATALGHSPGEFDWWDYEEARGAGR